MRTVAKRRSKHMLLLFVISLILNAGIFFLDEGKHSFDFLSDSNELINLVIFAAFFSLFPISVYNLVDESKYKRKAVLISMIGYIPFALFVSLPWIIQVVR